MPVISPYLFNAANLADPHTVVYEQAAPFDAMPSMIIGPKPIDGGNYILSDEERDALINAEPRARAYLHPFIGSEEFINGGSRWILALHNATPSDIRAMKDVHKRVEAVRAFRKASKSVPTQKLAETPTLSRLAVARRLRPGIRAFLFVISEANRPKRFVHQEGRSLSGKHPIPNSDGCYYRVRRTWKAAHAFKKRDHAQYACLIEVYPGSD